MNPRTYENGLSCLWGAGMCNFKYIQAGFKLTTLRCSFIINVSGYLSHYLVNESIIHLQMEARVLKQTHLSEIWRRRRWNRRTFQCRGLNCEFMCLLHTQFLLCDTWHVHRRYGSGGDQSGGRLLLYGQRGHGIAGSRLAGGRRT